MLIDTDDILHSENIYLKLTFKDGKVFETKIETSKLKTLELKINHTPYRKSIWESDIQLKTNNKK